MLASSFASASQQQAPDDSRSALADAAQQAQAGDTGAAAADYREAVRLYPNVAELWANLGLMQHQAGAYADAVGSFRRAIALKNSLFVPNLFMGIDLLKLKCKDEAVPYLLKAQKLNPSDVQAPLALGQAYAALKETRKAMDAYAKAATLDSRNSDAWFGLGVMALAGVEVDARVTRRYKGSGYFKLLSAETFADMNRLEEASDLYAALLGAPGGPPCSHTEYGFVLLRKGELARAKATIQAELATGKECPLASLAMVRVSLNDGDYEAAGRRLITLWESKGELVQTNAHFLWDGLSSKQLDEIGNSLNRDGASGSFPPDLVETLKDSLHRGDTTQPLPSPPSSQHRRKDDSCGQEMASHDQGSSSEALLQSVACLFYAGDYRTAAVKARMLVVNEASRSAGLYWEIKANQKLAVLALDEAGRNAPNSPKMHVLLGDIFRQRERYPEAEAEYKKALAVSSELAGALLGLSTTYFLENKWDEALSSAERVLKENSNHPRANLLVAEVLVARHEYAGAEPHLKVSLAADPEILPRVHALLGNCYAASDRVPEAIHELELALPSDEDGGIHYQIAQLYKKSGDPMAAAAALKVTQQLKQEHVQRDTVIFREIHQSLQSSD